MKYQTLQGLVVISPHGLGQNKSGHDHQLRDGVIGHVVRRGGNQRHALDGPGALCITQTQLLTQLRMDLGRVQT